jgi:hypothetical protein
MKIVLGGVNMDRIRLLIGHAAAIRSTTVNFV